MHGEEDRRKCGPRIDQTVRAANLYIIAGLYAPYGIDAMKNNDARMVAPIGSIPKEK
jgi:hypothetical protein